MEEGSDGGGGCGLMKWTWGVVVVVFGMGVEREVVVVVVVGVWWVGEGAGEEVAAAPFPVDFPFLDFVARVGVNVHGWVCSRFMVFFNISNFSFIYKYTY